MRSVPWHAKALWPSRRSCQFRSLARRRCGMMGGDLFSLTGVGLIPSCCRKGLAMSASKLDRKSVHSCSTFKTALALVLAPLNCSSVAWFAFCAVCPRRVKASSSLSPWWNGISVANARRDCLSPVFSWNDLDSYANHWLASVGINDAMNVANARLSCCLAFVAVDHYHAGSC